jgi:hypothetical protein
MFDAGRFVLRLGASASTIALAAFNPGLAGCALPPPPRGDHIAMMQLSLSDPADRRSHGPRIALMWSDQDYRPRIPGVYAMKYMMADRDVGRDHDTAWHQANHPDWLARKCDGAPAQEFKYPYGYQAPLDIENPRVRGYLLQRSLGKVLHSGRFDAVAVDNLSPDNSWGRCGVSTASGFRREFAGTKVDPVYTAALADWTSWLKTRVNAAGLCLAGNDYFSDDNPQGFLRLARALDIVVDEHGFTRLNRPQSLDAAWAARMDAYRQIPAAQPLVIIDYPAASLGELNNTGLSWSMANFLLVKRRNTYLSATTADGFDDWKVIPALDILIGAPMEAMREDGGLYIRRFERVIAIVNPSSRHEGVAALPAGAWRGLDGRIFQGRLTLSPASAAVLAPA